MEVRRVKTLGAKAFTGGDHRYSPDLTAEKGAQTTGADRLSDPPTQAEVQALRHASKELADALRNLSTLIHSLRTALVAGGLIEGGGA